MNKSNTILFKSIFITSTFAILLKSYDITNIIFSCNMFALYILLFN